MIARPARLLCAAASLGVVLPGCGGLFRNLGGDLAQDLPERVTEGSLVTLEDRETRDRMMALLEGPEMQRATRALVASVVDGSLEALSDEERAERIARASDAFVSAISSSVGDAIDREVGPALARSVARTLEASLASIASERNLERLRALVQALAREAAASMGSALRDELGPAAREALREALSDEETRQALADTTRQMSHALVLGMEDALQEIRLRERDAEPDTLLERVRGLARGGRSLVEAALVAMALGLVLISLWLLRSLNDQRRQAAEAHKREAAILALTAILREGGAPPADLLDTLRASFETRPAPPSGRWWRGGRGRGAPPAGGTPRPA